MPVASQINYLKVPQSLVYFLPNPILSTIILFVFNFFLIPSAECQSNEDWVLYLSGPPCWTVFNLILGTEEVFNVYLLKAFHSLVGYLGEKTQIFVEVGKRVVCSLKFFFHQVGCIINSKQQRKIKT